MYPVCARVTKEAVNAVLQIRKRKNDFHTGPENPPKYFRPIGRDEVNDLAFIVERMIELNNSQLAMVFCET